MIKVSSAKKIKIKKCKTDAEIWKYVCGLTGQRLNPDEGHSSLVLVQMSSALMLENPGAELTTCLLQKSEVQLKLEGFLQFQHLCAANQGGGRG